MTLDLQTLKASLAKISKISLKELTFKAGETELTLRVTSAEEDGEIERWGQLAWDNALGDQDASAFGIYLDRMRIGTLSYAVVQIDNLDLRGVSVIETGEILDGKPVLMPKHEAVRSILSTWPRHLLHFCFLKYGELLQKNERDAVKAIDFNDTNIDDELERLRSRIEELEDIKAKRNEELSTEKSPTAQTHRIVKVGQEQMGKIQETLDKVRAPQPRQESVREEVSPPPAPEEIQYVEIPEPSPASRYPEPQLQHGRFSGQPGDRPGQSVRTAVPTSATPPARVNAATHPDLNSLSVEDDSMFDPGDEEALQLENERLLRQRTSMRQQQEAQEPAYRPTVPTGLRQAMNAQNAVVTLADEVVTVKSKGSQEEIKGVRLPTEVLQKPTAPRPKHVPVNQVTTPSKNPRFRGAGG